MDTNAEKESDSENNIKPSSKEEEVVAQKPKNKYVSWLRSEPMALCQIFLQSESAYACVNLFGEIGMTEFRDLNKSVNAFQRKFVNELRRCDEMERQLKFFEKEILQQDPKLPLLDYDEEPGAPSNRDISKLEAQFEKIEHDLVQVNNSTEALKKTYLELTELRYILKKTGQFFEEAVEHEPTQKAIRRLSTVDPRLMRRFSVNPVAGAPDINIPLDPVADINFIAGTLLRSKLLSFERMLFRVCRGNIFLRQVDIEELLEDPKTGEMQSKCIFIIVFQGDQLKGRVRKICEGYHATLYPCPERPAERKDMHAGLVTRVDDLQIVMKQTGEHKARILTAVTKNLKKWRVIVGKMKAIYETMNMFSDDITAKCLIAECWCPVIEIPSIQEALRRGQEISQSAIPSILTQLNTLEEPPTLNITNKFTTGFQAIIDSYGVNSYREVNPMPFTIITFPFIFAVMFGDMGHGLIMMLFGLWLVLAEKSLEKKNLGEIVGMFFSGRYIILLMGVFSIYTGLLYNDIFSKSINIFGSAFTAPDVNELTGEELTQSYVLDPNITMDEYAYPLGMDPIWQLAENKILYLNSVKMKISVILGVMQMLFGVFCGLFNHIYFHNGINILCEFIPQVVFLVSIFGYMNFMIVFKWFKYDSTQSGAAPSVLITLINMFMMKQPQTTDPQYLREPLYGPRDDYSLQNNVQLILLLLAVVCIPWMLLVKPLWLKHKFGEKSAKRSSITTLPEDGSTYQNSNEFELKANNSKEETVIEVLDKQVLEEEDGGHGHGAHGGKFDFGDTFIHQAIHTIEYCLGSISHTASYLRLWALSLAHAELSEVLWNMVMIEGFMQFKPEDDPPGFSPMNIPGGVIMFIIFGAWAVLTICILLLMEGLSAFLHALRLHWVEYQSKFYLGAGYGFQPFSFKAVINDVNGPKE